MFGPALRDSSAGRTYKRGDGGDVYIPCASPGTCRRSLRGIASRSGRSSGGHSGRSNSVPWPASAHGHGPGRSNEISQEVPSQLRCLPARHSGQVAACSRKVGMLGSVDDLRGRPGAHGRRLGGGAGGSGSHAHDPRLDGRLKVQAFREVKRGGVEPWVGCHHWPASLPARCGTEQGRHSLRRPSARPSRSP